MVLISAKSWLKNLSLFAISVLLSLLTAEGVVRFFYKNQIVLFPRYHTSAHYGDFVLRRLRPNTVFWHSSVDGSWKFISNAQGFRDERDYHYEKPRGRLRVLSLGDSHTEGFEVRQGHTFSAAIERFLNSRGIDAEVLNAGISGFGTAEELVFLESEGVRYQPDIVVLGFFANDLEDNIKAGLFKLQKGKLVVAKHEHVPGVKILDVIDAIPLMRWLSENSYLYSFALNTVWERAKAILLSEAEVAATTEYAVATESISDIKKELMAALLRRMYEFCDKRGIKLIVLDIPSTSIYKQFHSSIPEDIKAIVRHASHRFIDSEEVLGKYRNVVEIHVPHGHRHISEFTHATLGVAAASEIMTLTHSYRP